MIRSVDEICEKHMNMKKEARVQRSNGWIYFFIKALGNIEDAQTQIS